MAGVSGRGSEAGPQIPCPLPKGEGETIERGCATIGQTAKLLVSARYAPKGYQVRNYTAIDAKHFERETRTTEPGCLKRIYVQGLLGGCLQENLMFNKNFRVLALVG